MVEGSQASSVPVAKMPQSLDTSFTQRRRPYRSSRREVSYREERAGSSKRDEVAGSVRKAEEQEEGRRIEGQHFKSFRKQISDDENKGETEAAAGEGKKQKGQKSKWVFTEEGWSNIRRLQEDRVRSSEEKDEIKKIYQYGKEERGETEEETTEEEGEEDNFEGDDKEESHVMMEDEGEEVYREEDEDGSFDDILVNGFERNIDRGNNLKCKHCGNTNVHSGSMKSHKCKVQKDTFLNCDLCLTWNKHSVKVLKTGDNSYICGVCNTVTIVYLI